MSLRLRNQEDKRRRIHDAAEALFHEKGFALTTTREIAERAGIATGTLFLYVSTKEELLLFLWKDRLGALVEEAWATRPPGGLLPELVHIFQAFFDWYARDPALSRVYVRELLFPSADPADTAGFTMAFLSRLGLRLGEAVEAGELAPATPIPLLCANLFGVYLLTLTGWLNGQLPLSTACLLLAESFAYQLQSSARAKGPAPEAP